MKRFDLTPVNNYITYYGGSYLVRSQGRRGEDIPENYYGTYHQWGGNGEQRIHALGSRAAILFLLRPFSYDGGDLSQMPEPASLSIGSGSSTLDASLFSEFKASTLEAFFGSTNNLRYGVNCLGGTTSSNYRTESKELDENKARNSVSLSSSNANPYYYNYNSEYTLFANGSSIHYGRDLEITDQVAGSLFLTPAFCEYFGISSDKASNFEGLAKIALHNSKHFSQSATNRTWYKNRFLSNGVDIIDLPEGSTFASDMVSREVSKSDSLLFENMLNETGGWYPPDMTVKDIVVDFIKCLMYAYEKKQLSYLKNYYAREEYDPCEFTYNATIDENKGQVIVDIVKNLDKIRIGSLFAFDPLNFTFAGGNTSISCKYEFYVKNESKEYKFFELPELNHTGTYRATFPIYQLISNSAEYLEYLKNPSGFLTKYFNNRICSREVVRFHADSFITYKDYDWIIYDSRKNEASNSITYGYAIPISHCSDKAGEYIDYAESQFAKEGSGPSALLDWLLSAQVPLPETLNFIIETLKQITGVIGESTEVFGIEHGLFTYIDKDVTPSDLPNNNYSPDEQGNIPEVPPTPPDPSEPDATTGTIPAPTPIPVEVTKTVTGDARSLYTVYKCSTGEISELSHKLWHGFLETDVLELIKQIQTTPIENIISLKLSPWVFEYTEPASIHLGNLDMQIPSLRVQNDIEENIGTFTISQVYGSFLDFSPFTTYEVYLPYVGYVQLDSNFILNKELKLFVYIDKLTLIGKYQIIRTSDNMLIGEWEFNAGAELPISATNYAQANTQKAANLLSSGLSFVAGKIGGTIEGLANAITTQTHVSNSGKMSANTANMTNRMAYIRITRPYYQDIQGFAHALGRMCNLGLNLSQLNGFTKIAGSPDLGGLSCTQEEKDELENILTSGFVI